MTPEQCRTLSNLLRGRMRRLGADLDVLRATLEAAVRSGDCPPDIVETLNSEVAEWLRISEQFEADIARLESGEIDTEQLDRMTSLN